MCHVIEEPWEVFSSWWGTGKCIDCNNVGRVLVEEVGPEHHEESDDRVFNLMLNDGVPDLRSDSDEVWDAEFHDEFAASPSEVFYALSAPREEIDTQMVCERCLEVRRWLSEWCHSWMYGMYREDVIGHWVDFEVARHMPLGRLVVLAERNWRATRKTVGQWNETQPLVAVETVRTLVDESLGWLRATTGRQYAA